MRNQFFKYSLFFLLISIGLFFSLNKSTEKDLYVLPNNYSGWICVFYNSKNKTPIKKIKDNYSLFNIPENGILYTSSIDKDSISSHKEFFFRQKNKIIPAKNLKYGGGFYYQNNTENVSLFWVSSGNIKKDYKKYVELDFGKTPKDLCKGRWY